MEKRKMTVNFGWVFFMFIVVIVIVCILGIRRELRSLDSFDTYGRELMEESVSPDGRFIVCAYLTSGGATTDYAVLGTVREKNEADEKNIYLQYRCETAEIEWLDHTTVSINGVVLDVRKDTYDYRREN